MSLFSILDRATNLKAKQAALLEVLFTLDACNDSKRRGYIYAGRDYFASKLHCSPRTITRITHDLAQSGYIQIKRCGCGLNNRIYLTNYARALNRRAGALAASTGGGQEDQHAQPMTGESSAGAIQTDGNGQTGDLAALAAIQTARSRLDPPALRDPDGRADDDRRITGDLAAGASTDGVDMPKRQLLKCQNGTSQNNITSGNTSLKSIVLSTQRGKDRPTNIDADAIQTGEPANAGSDPDGQIGDLAAGASTGGGQEDQRAQPARRADRTKSAATPRQSRIDHAARRKAARAYILRIVLQRLQLDNLTVWHKFCEWQDDYSAILNAARTFADAISGAQRISVRGVGYSPDQYGELLARTLTPALFVEALDRIRLARARAAIHDTTRYLLATVYNLCAESCYASYDGAAV